VSAEARIKSAGDAVAIDRFNPFVPTTYRAKTARDAPVRTTRQEAVDDEDAWLRGFCVIHHDVRRVPSSIMAFCPVCMWGILPVRSEVRG
jgi:hypothetical protein